MVGRWSIATKLFAVQFVVILVLAAAAVALSWADARADVEKDAAARSLAVAETLAQDPFVLDAVAGLGAAPRQAARDAASDLLQPYAVDVMAATQTDFVTIMTPDRIRLTHRDPAEIGREFLGTIDTALEGEAFTETYTGTLGPSVRAVVPVRDTEGEVVALVAAGITVSATQVALGERIATVLVAAGIAVLVGGAAAWALSRYLRRVTDGRGAEEMGRMFAYYEGVLHSIGEGLVLQNAARELVLYNDRAAELLGLPQPTPATRHRPLDPAALELPPPIAALLTDDAVAVDEIVITGTHVLVVDRDRVVGRDRVAGRDRVGRDRVGRGAAAPGFVGTVTTLRDHTRVQELAGELATMTTLSDALRSQAHEFANRLHTIIALIELDRPHEAAELALSELELSQGLADRVLTAVDEPVLLALLLGKSAQAAERGIALDVEIPERLPASLLPPRELITIVGNLLDNAMDAVAGTSEPRVRVAVSSSPAGLTVAVDDTGAGPDPALAAHLFELGTTTKSAPTKSAPTQSAPTQSQATTGSPTTRRGIGLALVRQAVTRLGGTITVDGSRFTVHLPLRSAEPQPSTGARA
ncbi:sensor histidine kinase [Herbiconiux liukaitaii]|uniref:sensor histidine kinase n=1 Tax=Herbiconiux liukaitaii TaxID=3342799 RepID=UPI0035B6E9D8